MKNIIFFIFFLASVTTHARDLGSGDAVGGLRVEDPFLNINKSGTTPEDRAQALRIMEELGYGTNAKAPKITISNSSSEGKN